MWNLRTLIAGGVACGLFLLTALLVWIFFVPPYNRPQFQNIENNESGFLVPLDQDTEKQAHFDSANYLKDRKVAAKRVQIHRRWVQEGWLYTTGKYIDIERLIVVKRLPVACEWTDEQATGTNPHDESLRAQSKDGTGLKLNFTCTAFIPESDEKTPEGTEHFLYYYKGDELKHVIDTEVRHRVQSVATDFCSQYTLETLRGTQHKLVEAVREDVIPFFKKRGIQITNIGMRGGFHYDNKGIQKSIDDAITAQQLKITAMAQQEKEKVENQTKLLNQEIDNKTIKLRAEGEALALAAKLKGEAEAKFTASKIDADSVKVKAEGEAAATVAKAKGEADAIKLTADAEGQKYKVLEPFKTLVLALKELDVERAKAGSGWQGGVPSTIMQGVGGTTMPIFPLQLDKAAPKNDKK